MQTDNRDGQQHGPYSEAKVRAGLADGSIDQYDLAWHKGAKGWVMVSKIPEFSDVPLSPRSLSQASMADQYSSASNSRRSGLEEPRSASFPLVDRPPQRTQPVLAKSSVIKAGWICLVLAILTFWIPVVGFALFSASFILAIVSMCINQVRQGLVLLLSSIAAGVICYLIFLLVVFGIAGAASQHVQREMLKSFPSPMSHR